MKLKINKKGVSLAISIGLLLLLMIITASVSQLVIGALKASGQVESSDKAYFAAEAGIEDALYELSPHFSGYQTSELKSKEVRANGFSGTIDWRNEWELKNKDLNPCLENDWENGFNPSFCGQIHPGEKLLLSLFTDVAETNKVETNKINTEPGLIQKLNVSSIKIKFRLPKKIVLDHDLNQIFIDNDRDYNAELMSGLNEDSAMDPPTPCDYSNGLAVADNDCDQKEDEDSPEDPVFIWKVSDDQGNSFQPLRGCKGDPEHSTHEGFANAGLCEKNFLDEGNGELSLSLDETDFGTVQSNDPGHDGEIVTLGDFIGKIPADSKLQMEILEVAPMKTINDNTQILIPYYEYGIQYEAGMDEEIPATFFSLKSDGYFKNYKQSITTKVVPGTTTRLLDLAIIQQ